MDSYISNSNHWIVIGQQGPAERNVGTIKKRVQNCNLHISNLKEKRRRKFSLYIYETKSIIIDWKNLNFVNSLTKSKIW